MAVNEGVKRVHTATIASAATLSAEVDLEAHYSRALIGIPTSSVGDVRLQVAENTGGTYKSLYSAIDTQWNVASSVSGAFIPVENLGRYVKVETTSAMADGGTFYIIGIE